LRSACTLGSRALSLVSGGNGTVAPEASSAAAGALILLERAQAALPPRTPAVVR
jgi:hypothetical protein